MKLMRYSPHFVFLITLLLMVSVTFALEDNHYFSVNESGEYSCIYVNLPQDLDVNTVSSPIKSVISSDKVNSPWIDTTESTVTINPGMLLAVIACKRIESF